MNELYEKFRVIAHGVKVDLPKRVFMPPRPACMVAETTMIFSLHRPHVVDDGLDATKYMARILKSRNP
jgi:hypothetical protein